MPITDEDLLSSHVVRSVVGRVRAAGVYKVAAAVAGIERVELPVIAEAIGTKLAAQHLRQQRIRMGIASLEALAAGEQFKQANFLSSLLKRAPKGVADDAAGHLTHLVNTPGGPALSTKGIAASFPEHALELPAYARQASEGGTFVPKEMPVQPKPAPSASSEGLKTKKRPTQTMEAPELPAMFRSGSLERGGQMGSGGSGIMAGGEAPPSATSFANMGAAPQGGAPAMFNLADLMKGKTAAAIDKALRSGALSPEDYLRYLRRGAEGMRVRPHITTPEGPEASALHAALTGFDMKPETLVGASRELKLAGIDLRALMGAAKPAAEEWRSVPGLLQNMPGKAPISPKLQSAMQGAIAPTPFSTLQPVPQQAELAALMAGNKLAGTSAWEGALMGALPAAMPVAASASMLPDMLKDPEEQANARKTMLSQLGISLGGSALGSIPGLLKKDPIMAALGSTAGGGIGAVAGGKLLEHTDMGRRTLKAFDAHNQAQA